jgi:transposase InsO family protein
MKLQYSHTGLAKICRLFGITRQAYYQHLHQNIDTYMEHELIIKEVLIIRKHHPRIGTRKLYIMLEYFMLQHQIKIGRDALFDLLSVHRLLIRRRIRKIKTTQSHHWLKKYPNLIKGFVPVSPNELYVSDITYWKIRHGNVYISLITDAYSRKIVGFDVSESLEATGCLRALQMALSAFLEAERHLQLILHSDRGIQYCCTKYVKLLQDYNIQISMTENGDPLDNAIAERVNGILKEEYLDCYLVENINEDKVLLAQVIKLYNEQRQHMSIGNKKQKKVHSHTLKKGERKWKSYYQKKETVNQF